MDDETDIERLVGDLQVEVSALRQIVEKPATGYVDEGGCFIEDGSGSSS
jgi:hypothetical protein